MTATLTPKEIFDKANIEATTCLFCHPNPGMEMYETSHFRLLRVNFPATAGHVMVSSKLHFGSLGELEPHMLPELDALKQTIAHWFREQCGGALFYEHGRAGSCMAKDAFGQQCEHFHLNCIPSNICMRSVSNRNSTGWVSGSPSRALYSRRRFPSDVNIKPK